MSSSANPHKQDDRDINELFDEICLTEERLADKGYKEGLEFGQKQGNQEGYQLGYSQGVQLGEELGNIFGFVVAQQQQAHTDLVHRALQRLRKLIEIFPRTNDPEANIIGAIGDIRILNKRLLVLLGTSGAVVKRGEETAERIDLSF